MPQRPVDLRGCMTGFPAPPVIENYSRELGGLFGQRTDRPFADDCVVADDWPATMRLVFGRQWIRKGYRRVLKDPPAGRKTEWEEELCLLFRRGRFPPELRRHRNWRYMGRWADKRQSSSWSFLFDGSIRPQRPANTDTTPQPNRKCSYAKLSTDKIHDDCGREQGIALIPV